MGPGASTHGRRRLISTAIWLAVIVVPATSALTSRRSPPEPDLASPEWRLRESAIARARVFLDAPAAEPELPGLDDTVVCQYVPKRTSAMSPKFDCRLESGEVIKVKYDTLEIQAETAATRLMRALGLTADEVSIVRRVRCHGCPPFPFHARRLFELFYAGPVLDRIVPERVARDFEWVSIERKFPARAFEIDELEGWHWGELSSVRQDLGGASRAELDALRLFAVLIGHWDNKLDNQRLICLEDDREDSAEVCERPALMIHDVGATFGTKRVDLASWQAQPIWADGQSCRVSMNDMPLGPGTFVPVEIGEPGRRLLASKLAELSEAQMTDLFAGARFPDPRGRDTGDVTPWVRTLQAKIGEIASRRCHTQSKSLGGSMGTHPSRSTPAGSVRDARHAGTSAASQAVVSSVAATSTISNPDVGWEYGRAFRHLQDNGQLIGTNDLWIAATALANRLPVVTRNVEHYRRVPGLEVIGY